MKLSTLIENINTQAPGLQELLHNAYEKETAEAMRNLLILPLKNENINEKLPLLKQFFENVDYNNFQVLNLFFSDLMENEQLYLIGGTPNGDFLIADKKSGVIAIADYYSNKITDYIAPDFQTLLQILPILVDYSKKGLLNQIDSNAKKKTLSQLKKHLDKKYFKFYKNLIGK